MNRAEVVQMIAAVAADYAATLAGPQPQSGAVTEDTRLFGTRGLFDSIGLVSIVADLEDRLNERTGAAITIADARALSAERSPFRTVGSLADHVLALLAER